MWQRREFATCMVPLAEKNTHAVQSAEHHTNKNYGEEIHRSIMRSKRGIAELHLPRSSGKCEFKALIMEKTQTHNG
jgi:hypothetical protein